MFNPREDCETAIRGDSDVEVTGGETNALRTPAKSRLVIFGAIKMESNGSSGGRQQKSRDDYDKSRMNCRKGIKSVPGHPEPASDVNRDLKNLKWPDEEYQSLLK
ncbi:hypothetical protein DMENIID0001_056460 [Sergentomyia squamirostris]